LGAGFADVDSTWQWGPLVSTTLSSLFSPLPLLCSLPPALRTLPCSPPPASRGATPLPPAGAGYAAPSLLPPRTTWRAAAMELELTGDGEGGGWVAKGRLGSFSEARHIMCARRPPGTRAAGGRQRSRRFIHGGRGWWMAGGRRLSAWPTGMGQGGHKEAPRASNLKRARWFGQI